MAKIKQIKIKLSSITHYLRLWNGIFRLTERELEILSLFVELELLIQKEGLNINPFSAAMKKKVARKIGFDDFNKLNVYIKSFVNKKAIYKENGQYAIHGLLVPRGENKVVFNLSW